MALTNGYSNWWGLEEFVRMCLAIKRLTTWILGSNYLLAGHTEILDGGYWTVISRRLNSSKLIKIIVDSSCFLQLRITPSHIASHVKLSLWSLKAKIIVTSIRWTADRRVGSASITFCSHSIKLLRLWKASRDRIVACRHWTIATQI